MTEKEKNKKWRQEHLEEKKEYDKKWYQNNRERLKEYSKNYYREHLGEVKEAHKKWCQLHWEEILEKRRENPMLHLNHNFSGAINKALKRGRKRRQTWESLVGYTTEQLKQRLECQFVDGMNWGNYGKWHIDHKKPKSLFYYTSPNEQAFQDCWALANLQPLWAQDNFEKSNKFV